MKPRRAEHRTIVKALRAFDAAFLDRAQCYFGGGTYLSLTLGEYRVSRDIDFLCASQPGFRALRETISHDSLGDVLREPLPLAREVRADRDGVRTFLELDGERIKLVFLRESRIALAGSIDARLGVPALTAEHCVAEKLLANADRGLGSATHAHDLVDLAFIAAHFGKRVVTSGLVLAEQAYGTAVRRYLLQTLDSLKTDRARANACIKTLEIDDVATLRKGLRALESIF